MKAKLVFIIIIAVFISCSKGKDEIPTYKNSKAPVEQRVNDLISRMDTLEKIKQLDMYWGKEVADMDNPDAVAYSGEKVSKVFGSASIGSIHDFYPDASIANQIQKYAIEKTRLGIPVMFIEEGLHGYCGKGSTTFPIPLQLAGAFDPVLVREVGRVIGTESRAHAINMLLGPVLDLAREPRWGRVEETFGEDPCLAAANAVAIVKGMQGRKLTDPDAVIAEPKHFAVHGVPEAGSNASPVFVSEREARSTFLYPFEKAVIEGGALGIMAAYHELDGVPCVSNKWLLTDVLRKEWGFKGFVISDLGAIAMTIETHKTAENRADAIAQVLKAGLNMQFYDFSHEDFVNAIILALKSKLMTGEDLNNAVRYILYVKFVLGLFDNPYIDTSLQTSVSGAKSSRYLALKAAQESIVLLKNEESVLPIENKAGKIAVIGELAESTHTGGYSPPNSKAISILDGIKNRISDKQSVHYEKGYGTGTNQEALEHKAVALAGQSDVVIVVIGERVEIVGEGKDRSDLALGENQLNLLKALKKTGKPIVAVLFNGRPIIINWVAENIPAIVESWFSGESGGLAVADVLLGNVNPSGKLPVTFPRSMGQIPIYYNYKPSSRHSYVDIAGNCPLYAFGHGLSYTSFEYSSLEIKKTEIKHEEPVEISLKVTNTGKRTGKEVVQLYIRDKVSSVTTPVKQLKGFKKIELAPGEKKIVDFTINYEELSLWNRDMKRVVEPGSFEVQIGSSSDDIRLKGDFEVVK